MSSDPVTGETDGQLVTALPRTGTPDDEQARDLVTVTVDEDADGTGDGQITSTAGHAYWTADTVDGDGYWAPARDLVTGAWLRTSSGTWVQTTAITAHTTQTHTYNLTIANHHTYYVTAGNTDTLVHNCGDGDGLLHPGRNGADDSPQDWLPMSSWKTSGEGLTEGNYHFVVMPNKAVRTFHESIWEIAPGAGHTSLSRGKGVIAAGTFDVGPGGGITRYDNFSGHYRPGSATQGAIRDAFASNGFDLANALWDPFVFK